MSAPVIREVVPGVTIFSVYVPSRAPFIAVTSGLQAVHVPVHPARWTLNGHQTVEWRCVAHGEPSARRRHARDAGQDGIRQVRCLHCLVRLTHLRNRRYIVSGDTDHHFFLLQYKDAYPEAKLIGVQGLEKKRPDLKFDGRQSLPSHI